MFFSYPFHIIRSYSFLLSGMHSLTYRARVGLFEEAFIFTDFNSTSCLANFSSWSWHFLLNPMLSPTKFVCDREMHALAETSWSLLLKGKSVCSKHIQKVSTRLGKKVFFKVWLVPDFIEINRKFPKALPKFAKSTCHLTLTWCWKKHPLHCLKQLRLWVLNIYSYQKCPSLLHLTTSNIL